MDFKNKNLCYFFFSACILWMSFPTLAQEGDNLVNNPGFENAKASKVRRIGAIDKAEGWYSPTKQRADLFLGDAKVSDIATPNNIYGEEEAKDGANYAGIIAYSYRDKMDRSYITTELKQPLVKGAHYKVQFYASLAELSKYSCNRLGVSFSKKAPDVTTKKVTALIIPTSVEHPDKKVFNATFGWDLVCGEYVATGHEKYLTIGVFVNDNEVQSERMRKDRSVKGQQIIAAYYYIDDVSVRLLGKGEQCKCKYPKENKDKIYTLYQRSPELTDTMSLANRVSQYQVYYTSGRYDIGKNGENSIAAIVALLKEHPNASIKITGHADAKEAMNAGTQEVSSKRAEFVKAQLVKQGIAQGRLITADASDRASSIYISSTDNEKMKDAKNRRVTFKLIK